MASYGVSDLEIGYGVPTLNTCISIPFFIRYKHELRYIGVPTIIIVYKYVIYLTSYTRKYIANLFARYIQFQFQT